MRSRDALVVLAKDVVMFYKLGRKVSEKRRAEVNLYVAQRRVDGYKIDLNTEQGIKEYAEYKAHIVKMYMSE